MLSGAQCGPRRARGETVTPSFFAVLPLGWSIYVAAVWLAVVIFIAFNVLLVLPNLARDSWFWMKEHLGSPPPAVRDSCLGPAGASPAERAGTRRRAAATGDEERRAQLNAAYLAGRR